MTQTKLDKLLQLSIDQHGYWLINHVEYIREDLEFLLKWHGGNVVDASLHLSDSDSDFVKKLYTKISEARGQMQFV